MLENTHTSKGELLNNQYYQAGFTCYGSEFSVSFDDLGLIKKLPDILPPYHKITPFNDSARIFKIITKSTKDVNGLYWDNEKIHQIDEISESSLILIGDKIQMALAIALPPEKYFLHAGAVEYKNVGIIIPGTSFSGKTTLTREFIKRGARYYSDDCAVIDKYGYLYPYSKKISVRKNNTLFKADFWNKGKDISAQSIGADLGQNPVRIGLIIFSEYEQNQTWLNRPISSGETVLHLAQNLFYPASMTLYPAETLELLSRLAAEAVIFCGIRGEAEDAAEKILSDFENLRKQRRNL